MTTAMVDFITRTVGWKVDARYNALSYAVNADWDFKSDELRAGSVPQIAPGGCGRSQAARNDRARLERSLLSLHGLGPHR